MPSSVVAAMIYDGKTARLRVVFASGAIYEYKKVPAAVYTAMKRAASKGRFLNNIIKQQYSFRRIK